MDILLKIKFSDYPHSNPDNLISVEKLPHNFYKVIINYGFKDDTNLPRDLAKCAKYGIDINGIDTSYFIGKESLIIKPGTNMNILRKKI